MTRDDLIKDPADPTQAIVTDGQLAPRVFFGAPGAAPEDMRFAGWLTEPLRLKDDEEETE